MELIGFGCAVYDGPMTLITAIRDNKDAVIASDTRVLNLDYSFRSDAAQKAVAINDSLIIAIGGNTIYGIEILRALGFRCQDTDSVTYMSSAQLEAPLDLEYRDARARVTRELRRIIPAIDPKNLADHAPGAILVGFLRGAPSLCSWGTPKWEMNQWPLLGFSSATIGKPPPAKSKERGEYQRIAYGNHLTKDSEKRLVRATRHCADYWGNDGPISQSVLLHRLSDPFHPTRLE